MIINYMKLALNIPKCKAPRPSEIGIFGMKIIPSGNPGP
jgi:hypothetical protein